MGLVGLVFLLILRIFNHHIELIVVKPSD